MNTQGIPSPSVTHTRSLPPAGLHLPPQEPRRRPGGFTLMELMGVLVILGLLSMALVPAMVREYDREARNREITQLERLSAGLTDYIVRTRTIPAASSFVSAIATQLGMHTNEVVLNDRGGRRVFLVDPSITNQITLPYSQNYLGNTNELGDKLGVVILTSVGEDLPASITNGFAASAQVFSAIWNATEGQIPSDLGFTGDGNDLRIQRVNLATLFIPLVLNHDVTGIDIADQGRFSIDDLSTNTLPTTPVWMSSYIKGSVLGLHDQSGSTNSLQAREVLQHPMSYVFHNQIWRGSLLIGPTLSTTPTATEIQSALDVFMEAPLNATAQGNPQTVQLDLVEAMISFVTNYVAWADAGFPSSGTTYTNITLQQQILDDTTEDLIHRSELPDFDSDPDLDGFGESIHDHCTPSEHAAGLCYDKYGGDGTCDHGGYHDSAGNCYHTDGSDQNECVHTTGSTPPPDTTDPIETPTTGSTTNVVTTTPTTESTTNVVTTTTSTVGGTDSTSTSTTTTTTTVKTKGKEKVKNNNGHGNNCDGVDSSNPGNGSGGPNGEDDPSGDEDDERR